MQELAKEFVPCADEVWNLQHVKGPEGELFRKVAEQGHYGGRTKPTDTRQGIYACSPSGELLASINSTSTEAMTKMLEKALAKWKEMPDEKKWLAPAPEAGAKGLERWERLFPADGLALRMFSRDLPREKEMDPAWATAWNTDTCWFRKAEARRLMPAEIAEGALHEIPRDLVLRLACSTLLDNVRGQTIPFRAEEIAEATLAVEVDSVKDGVARVRFAGHTKASAVGKWRVNGFDPTVAEQKRGYDAELLGRGVWDVAKERFVEFELVAAGTRWGGTQYNGRPNDLGENPMGHVLRLAADSPSDRVAPAHIYGYGWK